VSASSIRRELGRQAENRPVGDFACDAELAGYRLRNAGGAAGTFGEALTRIFISYSSRDLDRANEIRAYLSAHGVYCWLARDDVPPGASWGEAIVEALDASDLLMLVYSAHERLSAGRERTGARLRGRDPDRAVSDGRFPRIVDAIEELAELD
jgi:hypothetical protein